MGKATNGRLFSSIRKVGVVVNANCCEREFRSVERGQIQNQVEW